ncbi:bifunctional 23S rRNA (guanine(2069)-N(7))-methyltransferase RlmK/23S rRNA (guanine(2445)-N(2))-methyltransferase RlmL [Aquicella lusitana]|uniref:23S rRNA G2445 N2-methylase RlmL n=1 Tax=Aquicella lusitana TaxID=254246 RepID=A0A370GXX5_9COXI|nr:bifunctional 23S rRNA (guanine(2069)-N(7))-methyltransferase RlmK/23S rRNA (guanine(2445)-N(2))-methyltransferase RlmL [Aquicella lusitana]RDI48100.1 23S rRNA G2445 N2-methylase RlmL [Aquicella lusitana]VVC72884.1 Ribosomal RNA large subunit methyltransferase K/L [Aquicella lusitana]
MSNQAQLLFATAPKGLELLLVDELRALGAKDVKEKRAGVAFTGDLSLAYKACLWSRLANRILLPLATFPAATPEALYAGVQTINWEEHIDPEGTLAVHFVSAQSAITHSLFGAQKVKDAIVDQFREKFGVRPSVAREAPQVSVYVYLHRDQAAISLDLSGESLHKRDYRVSGGEAPLKENLAAAILLRSGWETIVKEKGTLLDPMCGSGTLLIEAALIAGNIAPGLLRHYFGFLGWKKHVPARWETLVAEAEKARQEGMANLPVIVGYDHDPQAIKSAFENIERAGLRGKVHVEKRELAAFVPKPNAKPGLVVVNPPYGERLGEVEELKTLYALLGERLKQHFEGWHAALFTGNPELGKQMGLRSRRSYAFFNGALPCRLFLFDIEPEWFVDNSPEAENVRRIRQAKRAITEKDQQAVSMFANRLRKNLKHLKRQAKRQGLTSYRVYDADIPEYAFVIDLNVDSAEVREYEAPRFIDAEKTIQKRQAVLALLPELLELPPARIFFHEQLLRKKK